MNYNSAYTATIASAGSLSGALDLGQGRACRVAMPSAWTAANLTFQVSYDGVTFNDLYDRYGGEYIVVAAASRSILLPIEDFLGVRHIKVRSGTASVPVAQAAARSLTVQAVPA